MEEEETLPKRKRASRVGCMCAAVRPSCFSMPSMTPRPPVWMQKCSKARPKSGMYALIFMPSTCSEPAAHQQTQCLYSTGLSAIVHVVNASIIYKHIMLGLIHFNSA